MSETLEIPHGAEQFESPAAVKPTESSSQDEVTFVPENPKEMELVEEIERLRASNKEKDRIIAEKDNKIKEKDRENSKLENLAYYDSATGLLNRHGLKSALEAKRLGGRAMYKDKPGKERATHGSMIVLDIDHFTQYNTRFGHNGGDKVLKAVADKLIESTRKGDLVARYGGDEIVVVLDRTDRKGTLKKLHVKNEDEEVGRARFNVLVNVDGEELIVTLSGGVTDFNLDEDVELVFNRADQALYQAKESGRDRIIEVDEDMDSIKHDEVNK
jgi:diguanylate cyclase (GGDEF)-like protein